MLLPEAVWVQETEYFPGGMLGDSCCSTWVSLGMEVSSSAARALAYAPSLLQMPRQQLREYPQKWGIFLHLRLLWTLRGLAEISQIHWRPRNYQRWWIRKVNNWPYPFHQHSLQSLGLTEGNSGSFKLMKVTLVYKCDLFSRQEFLMTPLCRIKKYSYLNLYFPSAWHFLFSPSNTVLPDRLERGNSR